MSRFWVYFAVVMYLLVMVRAANANPELDSLREGVKLCSIALNQCEHTADLYKSLDEDKSKALEYHKKEAAELRDRKDSILSNPWLYGAAGLVLGVIITK